MAQDNVTLANDPKLTGKKVLFDFSVDFGVKLMNAKRSPRLGVSKTCTGFGVYR